MIQVMPVTRPDRGEANAMLVAIGRKYPGGLDWLDRRLGDVEHGRAWMWRASVADRAAGLAIVTPKGAHHSKLSTLLVAPRFRRVGVGRALITAVTRAWRAGAVDHACVTVDEQDHATAAFFACAGFRSIEAARPRYGERFDRVFGWDGAVVAPICRGLSGANSSRTGVEGFGVAPGSPSDASRFRGRP